MSDFYETRACFDIAPPVSYIEISNGRKVYPGPRLRPHCIACSNERLGIVTRVPAYHTCEKAPCDHNYVPVGEYSQTGSFICTKCKNRI